MKTILEVIQKQLIKLAHDCSKGGLAVAASEICMTNSIGCKVSLDKVPGEKLSSERILFSESHSRYLLVVDKQNLKKLQTILRKNKTSFNVIGIFGGKEIQFNKEKNSIANLRVDKAHKVWLNALRELVVHG